MNQDRVANVTTRIVAIINSVPDERLAIFEAFADALPSALETGYGELVLTITPKNVVIKTTSSRKLEI